MGPGPDSLPPRGGRGSSGGERGGGGGKSKVEVNSCGTAVPGCRWRRWQCSWLQPQRWALLRSSRWQWWLASVYSALSPPRPRQLHRSPPPTPMTRIHIRLSPLPSPPRRHPGGAHRNVPSATLATGPRTRPRPTSASILAFASGASPTEQPRRCCSRPLLLRRVPTLFLVRSRGTPGCLLLVP